MSAFVNDRDVLLHASERRNVDPRAGRDLILTADAEQFHVDADGVVAPLSITITAHLMGLPGSVTWSTDAGGTLSGAASNVRILAFNDLTDATVAITAQITHDGELYEATKILGRVVDGAAGSDADVTPESVLDMLDGRISELQLYEALRERINLIDAEGTGLVALVSGLQETYGDTVSSAASAATATEAAADAIAARADALEAAGNAAGDASAANSFKLAAQSSNQAAGVSASAAADSATSASTYATAAGTAAAASNSSKLAAESASGSAVGAAAAAATARDTAVTKASDAATSAASASTSANTATTKAGEASTSATSAATSATNAEGSANSASTSSSNAATSAGAAGGSATAASGSASSAATQATSASDSASAASTARVAAESARDAASTSASASSTSASSAATQATNAGTSATAANAARVAAESARDAAGGSASAASTFASAANTSASNAATSASAASSSANTANTHAGSAATYRDAAAASAVAADGYANAAAQDVSAVTARLDNAGGTGVTVEQKLLTQAGSITGLYGQYTVKIDANGYVTGFGLASTDIDGAPTSSFIINADNFAVVSPGHSPKTMFAVGPIGGGAYDMVYVGKLSADNITVGTLNVDRIANGSIVNHFSARSDVTRSDMTVNGSFEDVVSVTVRPITTFDETGFVCFDLQLDLAGDGYDFYTIEVQLLAQAYYGGSWRAEATRKVTFAAYTLAQHQTISGSIPWSWYVNGDVGAWKIAAKGVDAVDCVVNGTLSATTYKK